MQTFTRAYDSYEKAKQAVNNLEKIGIPAADISVVANKRVSENHEDVRDASEAASGAGLGAALGGGAGLLAGLGMMAIPGLGPVVAVGWLASTALGVVAGSAAGGLIGALINAGTSEADSHVYSETVRRGGTLVTIRTDHPAIKSRQRSMAISLSTPKFGVPNTNKPVGQALIQTPPIICLMKSKLRKDAAAKFKKFRSNGCRNPPSLQFGRARRREIEIELDLQRLSSL